MRLTLGGGVTTLASILVATAQVQPPARPSPANESTTRPASIAGRVIESDGSAVPDVQVVAARREGRTLVRLSETATTSGFDGRYEIRGLRSGQYFVAARPTNATGPSRDTWFPGVQNSSAAAAVTVLAGVPAEGIDIWLTPAQRYNVSGRIFWPAGVTVENMSIDFGDPAGTRSGVWYVSDPGGLFTLVGIPPGPLVLLARAESDQGPLLGMASTDVTVDAVEDIRITIDRPGSVEGRVVYDEAPPDTKASAVALIQKVFRVSAIYPVPEATIDASNRFEIPDALGEYEPELRGLPAGYRVTRVMRNGVTLTPPRIVVAGAEVVTGIEIRVARQGR